MVLSSRQPMAGDAPYTRHVRAAFAAAAAAWPDLAITEGDFAAYLVARAGGEDEAAIERAHAADLFLACACSRGDEAAMRALEREHFGEIDRALRKVTLETVQRADVEQ